MDAFIENNKVPQSSLPCLGGDTCDVIKSNKNIFSAFGPILVANTCLTPPWAKLVENPKLLVKAGKNRFLPLVRLFLEKAGFYPTLKQTDILLL